MITDTSRMDRRLAPRRRKVLLPLAIGLAGLAGAAVWVLAAVSLEEADRSADRDLLRFADVVRGDLTHEVAVQGRVVASSRPTLFSPASGIATLLVSAGETVDADQVIVRVDSPELGNRLEQERSRLDALRSTLGRQELAVRRTQLENEQAVDLLELRVDAARRAVARNEEMSQLGIVNAIDLENARTELSTAVLELRHAEQAEELGQDMLAFELKEARLAVERQRLVVEDVERQVAELEVRAPFAGLVAATEIDDRDAVTEGQPLVGVVDLGSLEVEVNIPETFADDVAVGIGAVMTIESRKHVGHVTRVAPEVRDGQVTGRVAFESGAPAGLRQNQRVSTRLVLDHREAVLKVPRGPFLESGGGRLIYVVDDELARRRAVELGVVSVTEIEVVSGLSEGDRIVLSDVGRFDGADVVRLLQ